MKKKYSLFKIFLIMITTISLFSMVLIPLAFKSTTHLYYAPVKFEDFNAENVDYIRITVVYQISEENCVVFEKPFHMHTRIYKKTDYNEKYGLYENNFFIDERYVNGIISENSYSFNEIREQYSGLMGEMFNVYTSYKKHISCFNQ